MPLSFWIFLSLSIVSILQVLTDHGQTWREFKQSAGSERWKKGAKLFLFLWGLSIGTLVGTVRTGLESISSEKEMLGLRASVTNQSEKVVELEARLAPRTISIEQRERFISYLKNMPKGPVRIIRNNANSEVASYARQLREILDGAGYGVITGEPIEVDTRIVLLTRIGETPGPPGVTILFYGDGRTITWPGIRFSKTNDMVAMSYSPRDPNAIPAIINAALGQIAVDTRSQGITNSDIIKPGEWALVVHDRPR